MLRSSHDIHNKWTQCWGAIDGPRARGENQQANEKKKKKTLHIFIAIVHTLKKYEKLGGRYKFLIAAARNVLVLTSKGPNETKRKIQPICDKPFIVSACVRVCVRGDACSACASLVRGPLCRAAPITLAPNRAFRSTPFRFRSAGTARDSPACLVETAFAWLAANGRKKKEHRACV